MSPFSEPIGERQDEVADERVTTRRPLHYGAERVAFVDDPLNHTTCLLTTDPFNGNAVWEKLAWYETSRCHRELLFVFTMAFLWVLVVRYRRLAGLWTLTLIPALLEQQVFRYGRFAVVLPLALTLVTTALSWWRRRREAELPGLVFDEQPDDVHNRSSCSRSSPSGSTPVFVRREPRAV